MNESKIIAITTDPISNIFGYSLVFMKLFDYIGKNFEKNVVIICNKGQSSMLFNPANAIFAEYKKSGNKIIKTIFLIYNFTKTSLSQPKNSVYIVNIELPELVVGSILRLLFRKKVYCIVPDLRLRNNNISSILIHIFRIILLFSFSKLLFVNKFTMYQNRYLSKKGLYIGNPVF